MTISHGAYNEDGYLRLTKVDGILFTGAIAQDGSLNVYEVDGSSFVGAYHPCGAKNIVVNNSSTSHIGVNHPCGAMNVTSTGASNGARLVVFSYDMYVNFASENVDTSFVTCSRSTSGWAERLDGSLQEFAANELRITDKGLLTEEARANLFLNSFAPVTQTVTVTDATEYTISLKGSGSMTLSGAGAGTVSEGGSVTLTTSGTSLVCTISGTVSHVNVEAGSWPTSFIKTLNAAATRATDYVNFADIAWLTQGVGTVLIDATPGALSVNQDRPLTLTGNPNLSSARIMSVRNVGGSGVSDIALLVQNSGQAAWLRHSGIATAGIAYKHAYSWNTNDFASSVDGGAVLTDSSGTPPTITHALIGRGRSNGQFSDGFIRSITYWGERKSNSELQGLTS